ARALGRPHRQRRRQRTGAGAGRERLRLAQERKRERHERGSELIMSTEVNRDPSTYRAAVQKFSGALEPSWLADLRAASFAEFERAGFQTVAQEDWKYTNVSSIAKAKFTPVIAANGTGLMRDNGLRPFIYEETRNAALVFVNGIFRRDLSSLEQLPPG